MIRFLQKDNATQRILMIVFLGLVCLSMVIFMIPGISDFGNPKSANVYAKIGDEEITVDEIDKEALQLAQNRIHSAAAQQYASFFRSAAATQLVSTACLRQEARRVGLEVSNDELINFLKHGEYGQAFFPKGVFVGEDAYETMVDNYFHVSVAEFERRLKEQILTQKLAALVAGSTIVSPTEAEDLYKSDNTKVTLEYALFSLDDLKKQANPSEEDLRKYYETNKKDFANRVPETRTVNYVVINTSTKLPGAPQVSDADIQHFYDQHKSEFVSQPQARARHILIATNNGTSDADAHKKADDIVKKLRAGADFAATAKEFSDDTGSKQEGGELAPFKREDMVKPFADAAFSLPIGKISDPVKSDYGYHIIQVEDRFAGGPIPLEKKKAEIVAFLSGDQRQKYFETFVNKVADEAHKDGLAKAAADNGLTVLNSANFNQGTKITGIGNAPEFMTAAFKNEPNSAPVKAKIEGGYAVLQVIDKTPAKDQTFEEAQASIQNLLQARMARELMAKRAKALADRAHALNDFDAAAKELGVEVKTSAPVDKLKGSIPGIGGLQSLPSIFDLKVGEISGVLGNAPPTRPNQFNPGGENAEFVVKVVNRQEPSADDIQQNLQKTRDSIYERKSREAFELFQAELTQQMEDKGKIKYNDDVRKEIDKTSIKL